MYRLVKKLIAIIFLTIIITAIFCSCSRVKPDVSNFKTVEEFNRKDVKIGVPLSSRLAEIAENVLGNATIEYFSSGPDMMNALEQSKVDALVIENYAIDLLKGDFPFLKKVENSFVGQTEIAFGFPNNDKSKELQAEFNEFILNLKQSGELQNIIDYWMRLDLPSDVEVDFSDLKNINGELSMYTEGQARPFSFVYYGKNVGVELVLAKAFCKEKGYSLDLIRTSSVLPALTSGKCDFVGSAMEIIEERKSHILFSEPIYVADDYIVIRDKAFIKNVNFIDNLKNGFIQTFINESRYKLFLSGTVTTIIISLLTLVLGTIIGFFLYLAYYNGCTFISKVFQFLSWLFSRLPMLVFLMFILYVVFEKVDISGMYVAIISFTIIFATTVFSLIDLNVKNIEYGQIEAASSLGYNKTKIFFKIILPQILPSVLPAYQTEILNLVKSTSIVGYVMVSDLTKVGDLVRSRTYAAFYPLVAVAIIYIVLAKIITTVVDFFGKLLIQKLTIEKELLMEKTDKGQ